MRFETAIKEWRRRRAYVPELGERHTVFDWVREEDPRDAPMIDVARFTDLLTIVPDKVASSLIRARDERAGRAQILKCGLGYEECLSAIIVDGTDVNTSSTETLLLPANLLPANYLQPGGIPGRSLALRVRGRMTTLTTAATLTFKWGSKTTAPASTSPALTVWAQSGAITMDTTVQTNTQWRLDCGVTVRSVGSSGTVFAQGDVTLAAAALTIASQQNQFLGSAGAATPAAVTVDMTVPEYLALSATWSLTTAYHILPHRAVLEALN